VIYLSLALLVLAFAALFFLISKKGADVWLWHRISHPAKQLPAGKKHLVLAFVDHYEPMYQQVDYAIEVERVRLWHEEYPKFATRFVDSYGNHPKHTFFYPEEEYRQEHLSKIAEICKQNFGEIEVHLHHDNDTEAGLRQKIEGFVSVLQSEHGALSVDPNTGKPVFAFIHGNWALDNSGSHGKGCGVNNELIVLRELGCYADFTFPSAPSRTQPKQSNSIFYATDDPHAPKSYDTGEPVRVGGKPSGDLMLIQGPLGFNWKWRKYGILPRLDNSDVRTSSPTLKERVDFWIKQNIHVEGRPEWIFVKIHTHGTQEQDKEALFGSTHAQMYEYLTSHYQNEKGWDLHYVSAREMYNIVKAAEAGETGNPNNFRDYLLPKPSFVPNRHNAAS
jgi:hypothetical protein